MTKLRVVGRDGYYPLGSEKMLKVKNHISVPSFSSSHPPLMKCDISKQIDGWKTINAMYHQKNLGMSQTPPPLLGGAKIAAVVLHTMNIEGQIHQKNPGMGQTPPLPGNARILEAPVLAIAP